MPPNLLDLGQRRLQRALGGLGHLAIQRILQRGQLVGGQNALAQQAHLHPEERIALAVGLQFGLGAVKPLVVGERMGVRADAVAVHEGRPQTGAAVSHGSLKSLGTGLRIGAVHFGKVEIGKVGHQAGDVASRRVHLDRGADGVAVVFHAEHHG